MDTLSTTSRRNFIIDNVRTGQNIARLRKESGMSVAKLADALGYISEQAIYKWQWGKNLPETSYLFKLAYVLNTDVNDLVVFEDEDPSFFLPKNSLYLLHNQ